MASGNIIVRYIIHNMILRYIWGKYKPDNSGLLLEISPSGLRPSGDISEQKPSLPGLYFSHIYLTIMLYIIHIYIYIYHALSLRIFVLLHFNLHECMLSYVHTDWFLGKNIFTVKGITLSFFHIKAYAFITIFHKSSSEQWYT